MDNRSDVIVALQCMFYALTRVYYQSVSILEDCFADTSVAEQVTSIYGAVVRLCIRNDIDYAVVAELPWFDRGLINTMKQLISRAVEKQAHSEDNGCPATPDRFTGNLPCDDTGYCPYNEECMHVIEPARPTACEKCGICGQDMGLTSPCAFSYNYFKL